MFHALGILLIIYLTGVVYFFVLCWRCIDNNFLNFWGKLILSIAFSFGWPIFALMGLGDKRD